MNNWEYSESIESEKIVNIEKKYGNFIDGKFVTPKSKQYIDTISPSTEKILSSISIPLNVITKKLFCTLSEMVIGSFSYLFKIVFLIKLEFFSIV